MDLIIECESFPVILAESKELMQIIHFRDWLRECFQIFFHYTNQQKVNDVYQPLKLNKIKLRKHIKRLCLKGEIIIGLSPQLLPFDSIQNGKNIESEKIILDKIQELQKTSEIEINVTYCMWILSKIANKQILINQENRGLNLITENQQFMDGLNWQIDFSKGLEDQLYFWIKND